MSPVSAVMHKIDRAKVHLDDLSELIESWRELHRQSITTYDDLQAGEYIVEIRPPEVDLSFALVAGDFVSCLRASLDHLMWHMYTAANPKETVPKRLAFPVFEDNSIDIQGAFVRYTYGIPEEAVALIRAIQPYQCGNLNKVHYLYILNRLWNIDKHRHIPMHSALSEYNFVAPTPKPISQENFDNHAKIHFALTDKPDVKFDPSSRTEIIFGESQEGLAVTFKHLVKIYETVRNEVIPAFSSFLP